MAATIYGATEFFDVLMNVDDFRENVKLILETEELSKLKLELLANVVKAENIRRFLFVKGRLFYFIKHFS